jgi:hypothetical protein
LSKDNSTKINIIKNNSFDISVNAVIPPIISDTGYIIPIEIIICNYMNDKFLIKIKNIEFHLKNNKNEVFAGSIDVNIDTAISNLQTKKLPFDLEFRDFNRGYIKNVGELVNYRLEIIFPETIINQSVFSERRVLFFCKIPGRSKFY